MSASSTAATLRQWVARPWVIAATLLLIILLWLTSGLFSPERRPIDLPAPATPARTLSPVQVERLAAETVARVVMLSGRTAPARIVEVRAETSGRIVAIGAQRGTRVEAGALLLRLDSGDRLARLAQARAVLRQRELEYDGQLKLKPQGYISDAKLAEANAQLETARAELTRAQLDLARMAIRAPFAGALQERSVEIGDYVAPGTAVVTFIDDRTLIVAGSVAEAQIAGVVRGLKGQARLPTGKVVEGQLRYVAPVADEATRTFSIELEIANAKGDLPVGISADIELPVGEALAHRLSPALLALDDAGVIGVKILGVDGRVQFVAAEVVRSSAEGVWIRGLPDPADVIIGGQGFVRSGDAVQVSRTAAPAESTPVAVR